MQDNKKAARVSDPSHRIARVDFLREKWEKYADAPGQVQTCGEFVKAKLENSDYKIICHNVWTWSLNHYVSISRFHGELKRLESSRKYSECSRKGYHRF
jgi:hypothetical protein